MVFRALDRFEWPDGVHLRRLHYFLMSTTAVVLPGGKKYEGSHKQWKFLGRAASDARYLDLVPIGAFTDRRAPEPPVVDPEPDQPARVWVADDDNPDLDDALPDVDEPPDEPPAFVPTPFVARLTKVRLPDLPSGYLIRPQVGQRYPLELWPEQIYQQRHPYPALKREGLHAGPWCWGYVDHRVLSAGAAGAGARPADPNSLHLRL